MWMKSLFFDTPIDFERRCKHRIAMSMGAVLLGVVTLLFVWMFRERFQIVSGSDALHMASFYSGIGWALLVAGLLKVCLNLRYLRNPQLCKRQKIKETDERNRMLGLRCWAFAGYSLFLLLYVGVMVSGLYSVVVVKILLSVIGTYALLLLLFRVLLGREM